MTGRVLSPWRTEVMARMERRHRRERRREAALTALTILGAACLGVFLAGCLFVAVTGG